MEIGIALVLAGLAQVFCGFIFFRHPGVSMARFSPVWRASEYVTPPGVALWVGGMAQGFVGAAFMLLHVSEYF